MWLWALLEPDRLRPAIRHALRDPEDTCWLSPVSIWEASLLLRKRRIALPRSLQSIVAEIHESGSHRFAPVTADVALAIPGLLLETNDPADNFIAATAAVNGFTLVTADARLLRVPSLDTLRA